MGSFVSIRVPIFVILVRIMVRLLIYFTLAIEVSQAAYPAGKDYYDEPQFREESQTKYFAPIDPSPNITSVIENWKSVPNLDIDGALAMLPRSLRMSYVLMHNSGSIQGATFEQPRAILFSPAADLMVAFNGESQPGGNRIEAMAYNKKTEMYDLYEVVFENGRVRSQTNPKACMACHTSYRVPNWRKYDNWNGAYGAVANGFDRLQETYAGFKGGRLDEFNVPYSSGSHVFNAFKSFKARQMSLPRYRQLVSPPDEPFWPFSSHPAQGTESYDYAPNRRFGIGLAFHMSRSIGVRLQRSDLFKNYPATVTSALLKCEPYRTDLQSRILNILKIKPLFESADAIALHARKNNFFEQALFQVLAVAGIQPDTWRMDLAFRTVKLQETSAEEHTIGFKEMALPTTMVGSYLYHELRNAHPGWKKGRHEGPTPRFAANMGASVELLGELDKVIPLYSEDDIAGGVCADLQTEVARELRRNAPIKFELSTEQWDLVRTTRSGVPYVLQQCAQCHAHGSYSKAPYIPFDQPGKMRSLLATSPGLMKEIELRTQSDAPEDIRMPHGPIGLLPEKRAELIRYLAPKYLSPFGNPAR